MKIKTIMDARGDGQGSAEAYSAGSQPRKPSYRPRWLPGLLLLAVGLVGGYALHGAGSAPTVDRLLAKFGLRRIGNGAGGAPSRATPHALANDAVVADNTTADAPTGMALTLDADRPKGAGASASQPAENTSKVETRGEPVFADPAATPEWTDVDAPTHNGNSAFLEDTRAKDYEAVKCEDLALSDTATNDIAADGMTSSGLPPKASSNAQNLNSTGVDVMDAATNGAVESQTHEEPAETDALATPRPVPETQWTAPCGTIGVASSVFMLGGLAGMRRTWH